MANIIEALGRARPRDVSAWADRELWSPCFQVKVVGTTGSGDATIAGFLSALLRDLTPEEALTAAVAVGACNVEAADALSGLRPWEDTLQRVREGWPRHPLTVQARGWQFDASHQVWVGRARPDGCFPRPAAPARAGPSRTGSGRTGVFAPARVGPSRAG